MTGIPSLSQAQRDAQKTFSDALLAASPDFQTQHGYPETGPGRANLSMCANWTAERFGCLSVTLEMPFKDNADRPDATHGWSPERCRAFGAAHACAVPAGGSGRAQNRKAAWEESRGK